jgi:hypothetical protein
MGFFIGFEADLKKVALSRFSLKWIMTDRYIDKYFKKDLYDVYSPYYTSGKAYSHNLIFIGTVIKIIEENDIKLRFKKDCPSFLADYIEEELIKIFKEKLEKSLEEKEEYTRRKI